MKIIDEPKSDTCDSTSSHDRPMTDPADSREEPAPTKRGKRRKKTASKKESKRDTDSERQFSSSSEYF